MEFGWCSGDPVPADDEAGTRFSISKWGIVKENGCGPLTADERKRRGWNVGKGEEKKEAGQREEAE
jgi:hypothetical protein